VAKNRKRMIADERAAKKTRPASTRRSSTSSTRNAESFSTCARTRFGAASTRAHVDE
jgi:hypothetical protein